MSSSLIYELKGQLERQSVSQIQTKQTCETLFYQRVVIVSVAESLIQLPGGVIEGSVPAEESDVSVVTPCWKQLINHQLFPKCIKCL